MRTYCIFVVIELIDPESSVEVTVPVQFDLHGVAVHVFVLSWGALVNDNNIVINSNGRATVTGRGAFSTGAVKEVGLQTE